MHIEYDRDTCIGMFQCVAEWDEFERDEDAG
jgi:ferredoxin